ncbi:MAG: thiamine diphosphokinase [Clostridiales bacterium]|nr:thiamine diphosphokinase [Clostridiales bacterium]
MCIVVIAGGPNKNLVPILPKLQKAERIICADSGADALKTVGIIPDVVWGDMDSISEETLSWLKEHHVENRVFPVEKDMTDSELCLRSLEKGQKVLFVTSLVGRTDHVMSNLLLVMRLTEEGYDIEVTDGTTRVYPLFGKQRFVIPAEIVDASNTVSLIPLDQGARNVSAFGMKYPLSGHDLVWGSSFTVSNEFDMTKEEHGFVMENGAMLLIVTPRS